MEIKLFFILFSPPIDLFLFINFATIRSGAESVSQIILNFNGDRQADCTVRNNEINNKMPPKGMVITQVNRLTDYQKSVIQYLVSNGVTINEILKDEALKRSDGSPILKKTVQFWIRRFDSDGHMNSKKSSGRPRLLKKPEKEKELIDYIKNHNKMIYREVKIKTKFKGHVRTLNHYALRNKISMLPSLINFV